jgi:hypothetical protein
VRERLEQGKMKIEDLKVGRVYRAKRPRVVHTLGGSYINDRQILYISPFEETIQYDSPKVGFGSRYPVISVEKFLKWAAKDITDDLPPAEWEEYKRCKMESKYMTLEKYAATLKVGDEVTIEYHSMAGDRQTIEKILKITKSGTIYLRSTNCKDAIRFRKNGQWLDNFGYQGGFISGYSLKNPYKNPFDFTRVKI